MKVLEILLQIISQPLFFKAFETKSKQLNLIKTNDDGINIMIYMIHVSQKKN